MRVCLGATNKQGGFTMVELLALLVVAMTALAIIQGKVQQQAVQQELEGVAKRSVQIFHALDDYYLANCNVASTPSLGQLKADGLVHASLDLDNKFGGLISYALMGLGTGRPARSVVVEMRSPGDARRFVSATGGLASVDSDDVTVRLHAPVTLRTGHSVGNWYEQTCL